MCRLVNIHKVCKYTHIYSVLEFGNEVDESL